MKITKYEHSCLDIELGNKRLLIDPGVVTTSVPDYVNVAAVVVTHVHPDHFDIEKLRAIHARNPSAPLYTVQAVSDEIRDIVPHTVVSGGQIIEVGSFTLAFTGGKHAIIHSSIPATDNVGLTINNTFYYSGDSLSLPDKQIDTLAVPIAAPWLKISEAMDFIITLKPTRVFAVHDALLSEFGMSVHEKWLLQACQTVGAEYIKLKPGEFISD